jgi:hypothetical protein
MEPVRPTTKHRRSALHIKVYEQESSNFMGVEEQGEGYNSGVTHKKLTKIIGD